MAGASGDRRLCFEHAPFQCACEDAVVLGGAEAAADDCDSCAALREAGAGLAAETAALKRQLDDLTAFLARMGLGLTSLADGLGGEHVQYRDADAVFESQQRSSGDVVWAPHYRVPFTTEGGEVCEMADVALPSPEWRWLGGWGVSQGTATDPEGWVYAATAKELDAAAFDADGGSAAGCRAADFDGAQARRRRWRRERMLVEPEQCPPAVRTALEREFALASTQVVNEKITERLMQTQDQVAELEEKYSAARSAAERLPGVQEELELATKRILDQQAQLRALGASGGGGGGAAPPAAPEEAEAAEEAVPEEYAVLRPRASIDMGVIDSL